MPKLSKKSKTSNQGIPLIAFSSMSGGALLGYIGGEFFLFSRPHPLHWAAAIVLGFIGYLVGVFIFRLKGDII